MNPRGRGTGRQSVSVRGKAPATSDYEQVHCYAHTWQGMAGARIIRVQRNDRIFVAGHRGLVGSALVRRLRAAGFENLLLRDRVEVDLTSQAAVRDLFSEAKPQYVFLAAGRVGGILANSTYPADFLLQNLLIQANVIDAAYRCGVQKLLT